VGNKGEEFDTSWARTPAAGVAREIIVNYALGRLIDHYTKPITLGGALFDTLRPPVIFVANHSSHLDTPSILRAMPRNWRQHTATIAAADYFYQNRVVAGLVTLSFATVPIERKGGVSKTTSDRIDRLVKDRWNLLLYPEGTRSRDGQLAKLKPGAAFMAIANNLPVVPIYVSGTYEAMPVGRGWPRKHPVSVRFGTPILPQPGEHHRGLSNRIEAGMLEMRDEWRPSA
jgi:1-acyl-sn-glycerol-3-phosphate acyltransferase